MTTDAILESEARKAWELYQSGVLREMYFSADDHEALLVLESENADEARRALSELPLMRARSNRLPNHPSRSISEVRTAVWSVIGAGYYRSGILCENLPDVHCEKWSD
jgi:muconolactone delta-isomerase